MSSYAYVAIDTQGAEQRGSLEVADPLEAVRRIKEMGLYPTKVIRSEGRQAAKGATIAVIRRPLRIPGMGGRVRPKRLCVFTRQLATLVSAGMPLLRSLRVLRDQEERAALRNVLDRMAFAIEEGRSLTEAVAEHPRVFNRLYVSMVKAGEISGAIDVTLTRLAEFIEKAERIKGRVKAAMFYPCSVLTVAAAVLGVMMAFVVPRFKEVFSGLLDGQQMPAFTLFVFGLSDMIVRHLWLAPLVAGGVIAGLLLGLRTRTGRLWLDWLKLHMPIVGNLFRTAAISRFARTLGALATNGVPILQALTIVRETAGNALVAKVVSRIHANVKEGEPIAPTLKASPIFPSIVAGMVDVGEQTGALPEMLLKVADTYDEEVDNATNSLTALLEPIMIVLLAIIVGGIVIAIFLPLVSAVNPAPSGESAGE